MDLSKKDKKAAREIIEKGLQKEMAQGLDDFYIILNSWREKKSDNLDAYHQLYKKITKFDTHISRRYDYVTGSRYLLTVSALLYDDVISECDLSCFSEEVREYLIKIKNF